MKVLCVDPSPWGLLELKHEVRLIAPGAVVRGCRSSEKAIALAMAEGCDVLLTEIDFGGPRWEGLELAKRVKGINPAVNIIFVTAYSERDYAKEVIQLRVSGFVRKPYEEKELARQFSNLLYPPA